MEQETKQAKKFVLFYPLGGNKILTDKTEEEAKAIARQENDPLKGNVMLVEITLNGGVPVNYEIDS